MFLAVLLFAAGNASAQVPTGSITGTVLDPGGLAVQGATVTLTNQGTGREETATSTDLGRFVFVSLNSGYYKVTVTVAGFKTHVSSNIKLDAGTQYSVPPIRLELGEVSATVTVEAGVQQVQTTDAQVSTTIGRNLIDNLPLLNRNPLALLTQQAGAGSPAGNVTVINGMRTSFANVTLDGINIQDNFIRSNALDFLPVRLTNNSVSEFTVGSQNTGTEAGLGASQVNFVTPSGTNEWNGEVFWYHRNNAFAARDWFDLTKQKLVQNQLGGSIGGPVFRDKLFVYGEYEAFRRRDSDNSQVTVLTPSARNGIFTYRTSCNNTTIACPMGVSPGDVLTFDINSLAGAGFSMDPAVAAILAALPTTINNFDVGDSDASQLFNTAGFRFNQSDAQNRDTFSIRTDYNVTSAHSISGTFRYAKETDDRTDLDATFNLSPDAFTTSTLPLVSVAWRWTPSARFTNEFRGGFVLNDPFFNVRAQRGAFVLNCGELLFSCLDEDFRQQGRQTNTYTLQDNASYAAGNHSMRFGWLSNFIRVKSQTEFNVPPTVDLDDNSANRFSFSLPGPIASGDLGRLRDLIADLGGYIDDVDEDFNVTSTTSGFVRGIPSINNTKLDTLAFYGGDSWKLSRRVTFNYGMRWELIGPFDEANGLYLSPVVPPGQNIRQVILDPATVLDFIGGDSGRKIYKRDLNNNAPNVGLAWDVFGDGRTALRAGYSIHYANDESIRSADNAASGNAGLFSTVSVDTFVAGLGRVAVSSGVPQVPAPTFLVPRTLADTNAENNGVPQTIFAIDPNLKAPYVQQWNLTLSRDIGWGTALDFRYIGNKGTGLVRGLDFNQVNINANGFLGDFVRARSNCFLHLAANPTASNCDGSFDSTIPGSQMLTVFPTMPGGGFLNDPTVADLLLTGEVGELAAVYHTNVLSGPVPFTANPLAFPADLLTNFSSSSYHAGVVEIRRRSLGEGAGIIGSLHLQANYTWSKVLTDSDGVGQTNFDPILDNAQPGLDRSRADFDLTHAFKTNFVYDLPFGSGRRWTPGNAFLRGLLSGWSLSSLFTWQSGEPFSIVSNRGTLNRAGRSTGKNTAVALISDEQINKAFGVFRPTTGPFAGQVLLINPNLLDPATGRGVGADAVTCNTSAFAGQAFCNPEPGLVGNMGRNPFNGPWFFNWDFAVIKNTRLTERTAIQFRTEFFNFPNHPTFSAADEDINSTNFGITTSTVSNPRIIQMALRLTF
ncbi:MAG: TonB-dependent receptor [Verrucomicrobiales bacterium]|nr:TonB-dependent receptor [Verrucomicrobiales bacterium]